MAYDNPVSVRPWRILFRTLFTTAEHSDAVSAGFERATDPGQDGGFAIHFDSRHSIASVVINGSDGEVTITGYHAIREAANALLAAEKAASQLRGEAA